MMFFVGLHQPSDCKHFDRAFVSVNRLRARKGPFEVKDWIMDSGAFTEIFTHGKYRSSPADYVAQIERWRRNGNMLAAVSQDWMCEPSILEKTGLDVSTHQRMTIERYDAIRAATSAYVMPVLQGFKKTEYLRHLENYGERLSAGQWVGVGSVCKRNGYPVQIWDILNAIKVARPDLRLHGFGLKKTALTYEGIRNLLYTADSMAWSYAARKQGRNANDWREAKAFCDRIETFKTRRLYMQTNLWN